MNRAVSRLCERMPLTKSLRVFSNTIVDGTWLHYADSFSDTILLSSMPPVILDRWARIFGSGGGAVAGPEKRRRQASESLCCRIAITNNEYTMMADGLPMAANATASRILSLTEWTLMQHSKPSFQAAWYYMHYQLGDSSIMIKGGISVSRASRKNDVVPWRTWT